MEYKQTTQVPNAIFDIHLPTLKESELKVLLVIIRQTLGWLDKRTGRRKTRDRISSSQFHKKTGLSQRIITKTLHSLSEKNLILITDYKQNELRFACDRKGKKYLFFSLKEPAHIETATCAKYAVGPTHKVTHNKTNSTKLTRTKRNFCGRIDSLVKNYADLSR
jgi:hypothetical protein